MEWAEFLQGMSGDPQMLSAEYLDLLRLTTPNDADLSKRKDHGYKDESKLDNDPGKPLYYYETIYLTLISLFSACDECASQLHLLSFCVRYECDRHVDGTKSKEGLTENFSPQEEVPVI